MSTTTNLDNYNARALDFLARLGAQPAVAFHEQGVATAVRDALTEIGVSWRTDDFGNIIARIAGTDADKHPPIALMAHMDHPGFEIVGRDGDYLIGKALGGVPSGSFAPGVPLHVVLPGGRRIPAETVGPYGEERERQAQIRLTGSADEDVPIPSPAVFDLPDFSIEDDHIVMRAADDLAGCGCILSTLSALQAMSRRPATCTACSPAPRRWAWWARACWPRPARCRWTRWSSRWSRRGRCRAR